jgi:hypothetical protein
VSTRDERLPQDDLLLADAHKDGRARVQRQVRRQAGRLLAHADHALARPRALARQRALVVVVAGGRHLAHLHARQGPSRLGPSARRQYGSARCRRSRYLGALRASAAGRTALLGPWTRGANTAGRPPRAAGPCPRLQRAHDAAVVLSGCRGAARRLAWGGRTTAAAVGGDRRRRGRARLAARGTPAPPSRLRLGPGLQRLHCPALAATRVTKVV